MPRRDGATLVAVGVGDPGDLTPAALRDAAAAFARAAGQARRAGHDARRGRAGVAPDVAAQAVVEGVLLARYRYGALEAGHAGDRAARADARRHCAADDGRRSAAPNEAAVVANAAQLARDLANTPPGHLTATRMADVATAVGAASKLEVEVFDADALARARLRRHARRQRRQHGAAAHDQADVPPVAGPTGHLALVGKGVMYDSGGISLKPSDAMHAAMKMDMSGAAAVLASMSALARARGAARPSPAT